MNLLTFRNRKPSTIARIILDKLFANKFKDLNGFIHLFKDKHGIEIGGPSHFFTNKVLLPIYSLAKKVDGCNFSHQTIWEGDIKEGETFQYTTGKFGHQFVCEGAEVNVIPKGIYDFLLSCNNLEHIANPLKAIKNWLYLLNDQGVIVLILPRKESNFDHRRNVTSFNHLLADFENNVGEDDLTHLDEICSLHDIKLDSGSETIEMFKKRSKDNFSNRCLHHHVYDNKLLEQICLFFEMEIIIQKSTTTDHIIIAKKS